MPPFDKQPHAVEQPFVKPFARGMIPHAVAERQVADELIIRSFAFEPHYIVADELGLGYSAGFAAASAFTLAQSIALWEISTPVKEAQGESIPRSKAEFRSRSTGR